MTGLKKPHATISQNPERKRLEFRKLSQDMPALLTQASGCFVFSNSVGSGRYAVSCGRID
jgi:hypothetical protein